MDYGTLEEEQQEEIGAEKRPDDTRPAGRVRCCLMALGCLHRGPATPWISLSFSQSIVPPTDRTHCDGKSARGIPPAVEPRSAPGQERRGIRERREDVRGTGGAQAAQRAASRRDRARRFARRHWRLTAGYDTCPTPALMSKGQNRPAMTLFKFLGRNRRKLTLPERAYGEGRTLPP